METGGFLLVVEQTLVSVIVVKDGIAEVALQKQIDDATPTKLAG